MLKLFEWLPDSPLLREHSIAQTSDLGLEALDYNQDNKTFRRRKL
jgi:hypothetical protein